MPNRCAVMLTDCSCRNGSSSMRPAVVTSLDQTARSGSPSGGLEQCRGGSADETHPTGEHRLRVDPMRDAQIVQHRGEGGREGDGGHDRGGGTCSGRRGDHPQHRSRIRVRTGADRDGHGAVAQQVALDAETGELAGGAELAQPCGLIAGRARGDERARVVAHGRRGADHPRDRRLETRRRGGDVLRPRPRPSPTGSGDRPPSCPRRPRNASSRRTAGGRRSRPSSRG